jgi:hypothetical protein
LSYLNSNNFKPNQLFLFLYFYLSN